MTPPAPASQPEPRWRTPWAFHNEIDLRFPSRPESGADRIMSNTKPYPKSRTKAWLKRHLPDGLVTIHLALTAVMFWLSFVLNLPGDTFAGIAFRKFAELGTEQQWAYVFFSTGCLGVIGLTTDRTWVRHLSVFVLAAVHGIVAACFASSPPPTVIWGTAPGTYGIYALLGYYLLVRRYAE